ncbi:hypothetical protein KSS87_010130, partial [Heliosperma pusillum]
QSTPQLFSKSALESNGARLFTHAVFEEFQEEYKCSTNTLTSRGFSESNNMELNTVKDALRNRNFIVQYNPGTLESSCTCKLFERRGVPCRHILWIYLGNGLDKIPESSFAKRWTKDALRDIKSNHKGCVGMGDVDIIDKKQIEMTKLWSEVHETMGVLIGREKEHVEDLCKLIKEFREKLLPSVPPMTKHQELEELLGCATNNEITILPPKISKNKGSGKRMLSNKAKAVACASKPERMCNNCKQMAHHDKRNCPNPFVERPPQNIDDEEEEEEEDEEEEEEENEDDELED